MMLMVYMSGTYALCAHAYFLELALYIFQTIVLENAIEILAHGKPIQGHLNQGQIHALRITSKQERWRASTYKAQCSREHRDGPGTASISLGQHK